MKVFWIVLLSVALVISYLIPLNAFCWVITICIPIVAIVRLIMSKHAKKGYIVQLCILFALGLFLLFVDNPDAPEYSYQLLDIASIDAIITLIIDAVKGRGSDDSYTQTRSSSAMWVCPGCGRNNARGAERCFTCGKMRPEYITAQVNRENERQSPNAPIYRENRSNTIISSGTWPCPTCGTRNKTGYPRCLHCDTKNPFYTPENPPEQPPTYSQGGVGILKKAPAVSGAEKVVYCRKCGKQIDDTSVFCRFCGTNLSVGTNETEEQCAEREYTYNNNKLAQAKDLMDNKRFEDARRILLEISGFKNADELAEKCLTDARDFRRHSAYLHAKAVIEQEHPTVEQIDSAREDFESLGDYLDSAEKAAECGQLRNKAMEYELARKEELYSSARKTVENPSSEEREILSAKKKLFSLGDYKDSSDLVRECDIIIEKLAKYKQAEKRFRETGSTEQFFKVISDFEALNGFRNSESYIKKCKGRIYSMAVKDADSLESNDLLNARNAFDRLGDYKDSRERAEKLFKLFTI